MSREVYIFSVTLTKGSTAAAPQKVNTTMPPREVRRIEWRVPPGPRGEVGFSFGEGGVIFIPANKGGFIVTDDESDGWDLDGQMTSGAWQVIGYNTGGFDHTLEVRYLCDPTGGGGGAPAPLSGGDLQLGDAGAQSGAPPPLDLPPPPATAPPVLPPPPELGGPGALPPLPLPGPPTLPSPPALPGLAQTSQTSPQPAYNWWNDAMGKLLTWPDQATTTRFDEVWLDPAGHVRWAAWGGGAGSWESYTDPISDQGGPFAEVSACFTAYQGVVRLNIVATAADGRRWLKVLNASAFSLIADWVAAPPQQPLELVGTLVSG